MFFKCYLCKNIDKTIMKTNPISLRGRIQYSGWFVLTGSFVMSDFNSWIRHWRNHDGCRMRSRKCLPFRSTWFHLWF